MGGITSTGLFSGIDANTLIDQLIQIESRPKFFAQQRLAQLQSQQAAYLDLNNMLSNLKSAASVFRTSNSFDTKKATSTNNDVLSVSASTRAAQGTYRFVVDQLVSSQQMLTRGFSDKDLSAIGLDQITIEDAASRLDRQTSLADLNDGQGIDRGKIMLNNVEIDLSRVATVDDVLNAINNAEGLTGVTASVSSGSFVITGVTSIANVTGDETADSLGLTTTGGGSLVGDTITGGTVFGINAFTSLQALNDGRGVSTNSLGGNENIFDFKITIDGIDANVRIDEIVAFEEFTDDEGETTTVLNTIAAAASNMDTVIDRINSALTDAGLTDVTASLDTANGRLIITDSQGRDIDVVSINSSTAEDLGLAGSFTGGTANGERVLAGLNTTLVSSLNGASGLGGDGLVQFGTADASSFTIDVSGAFTLEELITLINNDAGNAGAITASLNSSGNGLQVTDNTTGGADLVISGTGGADTAASLGLAGTFTGGQARGNNIQHAWISLATRLDTLSNGDGVGEGTFRITDSFGNTAEIDIDDDDLTLNDIVGKINGNSQLKVIARINDSGDGLLIEEDTSGGAAGTSEISIEDVEGVVADRLRIAGTASGVDGENFLDGSYEATVEFDPTDTLQDIVNKINDTDPAALASIINDGSGSAPFRMSFSASQTGSQGRFVIDTNGFDLSLNTLDEGQDAQIFFGSADPADGILLTSSTNTMDSVIQGVSINLSSTSEEVVEVHVTESLDKVETQIEEFVLAYNDLVARIDLQTHYNSETKQRGVLLGDGTAINLRGSLVRIFLGSNTGYNSTVDQLADAGLTLGQGGKIEFDSERFREAWERDSEGVEDLFTRRDIDPDSDTTDLGNGITVRNRQARTRFTALGVISQIEQFSDDYISSIGGVLTERNNSLNTQIRLQQSRIASFDVRLESRRQVLSAQFLAMEQSIARFQSQGSSLAMLG